MTFFFMILLVLYHYTLLSCYENRTTELGLMRPVRLPKWKRFIASFLSEYSPGTAGFVFGAGDNGSRVAVFPLLAF